MQGVEGDGQDGASQDAQMVKVKGSRTSGDEVRMDKMVLMVLMVLVFSSRWTRWCDGAQGPQGLAGDDGADGTSILITTLQAHLAQMEVTLSTLVQIATVMVSQKLRL